MLMLTGVSGLVDAASYLGLGHVFVANMTGNIFFVGFALAESTGLSLARSAGAIVRFLVGALAAGRTARRLERGHIMTVTTESLFANRDGIALLQH